MFDQSYKFSCVDRFLKYVTFDTQSNEEATCFPSTSKQLVLSRELVQELQALGIENAHLDENGYVLATVPKNTDKNVPVIGFAAHVDTSPAVSGYDVRPVIHKEYRGGDIILPADTSKVIDAAGNPELKDLIGSDIITSDGTTLLGADDKAGVAEIIDAVAYLIAHPEVKHGEIRLCFTPDEETGRGTEKINIESFGAKYAYTVDGSTRGEIETETFSADAVTIKFKGRNLHPGYAKGKMINSIKIASFFMELLPKDSLSPETTEGRDGYVHCVGIKGTEEETILNFIIRDFVDENLVLFEERLKNLAEEAAANYPGSVMEFSKVEQYRNMKQVLDQHPMVEAYAVEACERLGVKPIRSSIRGGTDGSKLSFMGIPTPNLFAGGHNFHSLTEWVGVEDMEIATKLIAEICSVWEEKAN